MIRPVILALLLGGAAQAAEPSPVGMVDNPCPEPLAVPAVVGEFDAAFLKPGPPDVPRLIALTQQPEFVAYSQAKKAREAQDWAGLCVYRPANAALLASGRRPDVVFLGDSITENWVKADPSLFGEGVVGRGIGGQTSSQMLVRFQADVVALRPRLVHIMAGTNDVAGNGGPTSPQAWRDNIVAMVQLARANGIEVVLASVPPATRFLWRPEIEPGSRIAELNAWLRDYAAREGLRYADYGPVLGDGQGGLRRDLGIDGVHPNRDGYAAMRPLAADVIASARR